MSRTETRTSNSRRPADFDGAAAVTRSLLGWGVVAGGFYLIVGLANALTREGFEIGRHPLSLLMLGERGWMQRTNLILTGLMVIAAANGFSRALRRLGRGRGSAALLGIFGLGLIGSGIFPPDPMAGFPSDTLESEATLSGLLHLGFGAVGFLALAVTALLVAGVFEAGGSPRHARYSRASGIAILLGFVGGASLSQSSAGVAALWIAVIAGWAWLAISSVWLYRSVPHPDAHRRSDATPVEHGSRSS